MHKVAKVCLLVLALLVLLLLAASWVFSSKVLKPPVKCKLEHHVFCGTPAELNLAYEEVSVRTADGIDLPSWFIPAAGSNKGIVLVHGHGGSRNEGLRFARALHDAGYNLLALNLRLNAGGFATMGYHEQKDVIAALDFLQNDKKITNLGLMGFSMGAATSIMVMDKDARVKAGLFSSPYTSALDVLSQAAKRNFGIPFYPMIPVVQTVADWRADIHLADVVPLDRIAHIAPRPLLIYHCAVDKTTDSSHSRILFDAAQEPKGLWIPECNKHERIWNQFPADAEKRTVDFFKKNL